VARGFVSPSDAEPGHEAIRVHGRLKHTRHDAEEVGALGRVRAYHFWMTRPMTLLTVHAHPDDETITTGGVMARYLAEGIRVVCLTSNLGEHGEIVVPELDTPENHASLAEIRHRELDEALRRLGGVESRLLGYEDSGMMGTSDNEDPASFWQADLEEATGRAVGIVREVRPDVIVGYNDFGGYGHPDHIRAAQVAKAAFERAGDPSAFPEQLGNGLAPWAPAKLYESVLGFAGRERLMERVVERGIKAWWLPDEAASEEERIERAAFMERMAAASGPVTTRVDVGPYLEAKRAALQAHVTQIHGDGLFLGLTIEDWQELMPTEEFSLRVARGSEVRLPEDDLFAGLH
jgi:N-acetyl-1-D-myo-inositol-2-amino-2-deoxy-alpha-D-glucopyranoside deacetylase